MTLEIRDAVTADWPQIWPIFTATVAAGETYAYDPMTSDEARAMWLAPEPHAALVAVEAGQVLGTAHLGPNRGGRGSHVGTASFMVGPAARGRGVGRTLGKAAIAWHRAHGFRAVQFNAVVETNTVAVALWQSLGFTIIGTVPEAFEHPVHGYVGLHVMHLPLRP